MNSLGIPAVCLLLLPAACAGNASFLATDMTGGPDGNVPVADSNAQAQSTCADGNQDANHINGPSICCRGSLNVCDGFEYGAQSTQPNATWWSVEQMNNSYGLEANQTMQPTDYDQNANIEITDAMAARGKYSLHVYALNENTTQNGWHHDMLVNRTIFPAPNNTFWGRAFIYFVNQVPNGHSTYMDATGIVPGNNAVTYLRVSTSSKLVVNYWGAPSGNNNNDHSLPQNANVPMPQGKWSCLEWEFKGDTNEVGLYLDGAQIVHVQSTDGFTAPTYDTFRLGWETYSYQYNPTPPSFDMYYDEVALDYERIGCDL